MARFLKQGRDADAIAADDAKVRATVEDILAEHRGARRRSSARTVGEV